MLRNACKCYSWTVWRQFGATCFLAHDFGCAPFLCKNLTQGINKTVSYYLYNMKQLLFIILLFLSIE